MAGAATTLMAAPAPPAGRQQQPLGGWRREPFRLHGALASTPGGIRSGGGGIGGCDSGDRDGAPWT